MNRTQRFKTSLLFAGLPLLACALTAAALGTGTAAANDGPAGAASPPPATLQSPRLDPELHDAVLQALNQSPVSVPAWLHNPFFDRSGISGKGDRSRGFLPPPARIMPVAGGPPAPGQQPAANGPKDAAGQQLAPFAERYRLWQQKARAAAEALKEDPDARVDVPAVTTVYSVTELDATGEGSQGSVWLHCKPLGAGFTAAPGTRFLDATFVGINKNKEAVFETRDGKTITLPLNK